MPHRRLLSRYLVLILAACTAGCGDGRVALAPVKGTVTLDGKPLASGSLTFESPGQRPATAKIVRGEIVEVTTYETGDGVPLGTHQVAVWSNEEAASAVTANPGEGKVGANYMVGRSLLPARYNDPATSGLSVEIKPGENVVAFQLTSKP